VYQVVKHRRNFTTSIERIRKGEKMRMLKQTLILVSVLVMASGGISRTGFAEEFPSYENLTQTNVSIEVESVHFPGGIDENGQLTGRGLDSVLVKACGSGFIVDSDGTIATNYHVIKGAQRAWAIFEDGSRFEIKHIKVYDAWDDLAVLKMQANKKFQAVKLGDSDSARPMDKILAVGNTLCQRLAVTEGIINQLPLDEKTNDIFRIRHSATIAPGNSGGALYNGENVVGINVAIRPGYNISYSVPVNKLKTLLTDDYSTNHYLADIFNPDLALESKTKQVTAINGEIKKRKSRKEPRTWSTGYQLYPLTDYLIMVNSPDRDLTLAIQDAQGNLLGYGNSEFIGSEGILLSSAYYQDVYITVLNYKKKSAKFGVEIYTITW